MGFKMSVVKTTGAGEQVEITVLDCNAVTGEKDYDSIAEMSQAMDAGFSMLDTRSYEMNMRGIEARKLFEYCTPGERDKITSIMDFLMGRISLDTIRSRWESSVEETKVLEEGRQLAAEGLRKCQCCNDAKPLAQFSTEHPEFCSNCLMLYGGIDNPKLESLQPNGD